MDKLLQPRCKISGQIFNITDGHPTNMDFIFNPLRKLVIEKNNGRNPLCKAGTFQIQIPTRLARTYSLLFSCLSLLIGKRFIMPEWGLTYMELHKVKSIPFRILKSKFRW